MNPSDALNPQEDDWPVVDYDPEEIREWLTTGSGRDFSDQPPAGDAPVHLLPPPGTPSTVLRGLRLPFEVDAAVRSMAEARRVTMSTLIREWINAGLAGHYDEIADPVVELRATLGAANRALDRLTGRDAA